MKSEMKNNSGQKELDVLLLENHPSAYVKPQLPIQLEAYKWKEIRLFLSSTTIDIHAERDALIKRVIPKLNRQLDSSFIRIIPVDLRWGVRKEESKDCHAIQRSCLNQIDKCRDDINEYPWFLGIQTERYGWIQDQLLESGEFENPQRYDWVNALKDHQKQVSITALECIHATFPTKQLKSVPNVFFYKRNIVNPEDIGKDMKWIFEFEYVPEEEELDPTVQCQYKRTSNADMYRDDKDRLEKYLQQLEHVKYRHYKCRFDKARITSECKEGKKSGVGYVTELEEFEEKVGKDLLHAIKSNFKEADTSVIEEHVLQNMPHENAMQLKASTFVGRASLLEKCYEHCVAKEVENSVMIIHGEPGCGKSALMAAVSAQCLNELQSNNTMLRILHSIFNRIKLQIEEAFVFVHAVDICPGSNNLVTMLKRLQVNLRKYRIGLGETDIAEESPTSVADLKKDYLIFLEESARKHPDKLFIILIDAVNQFHAAFQSRNMWWLPTKDAPSNIRFVISTLNGENRTLANARKRCPEAVHVEVNKMSFEDGKEMVTHFFGRFNKGLATTDDSYLGNQMQDLLNKNLSPLYLCSAMQALRQFGIWEEVSDYIRKLPDNIKDLFNFLLDSWSREYGDRFVKDVAGFLSVSKDGLLENELNDLLSFKEREEKPYDSSFSQLYDSLSGFLAAGGGGFLRFFHDQLKFEVKRKLLTPEFEETLHRWLVKFYLNCIKPQLCETPSEYPPVYYNHTLKQVVYHQLQSTSTSDEKGEFTDTLRNIFFVRERVTHQLEELLHQEYLEAIRKSSDDEERKALEQWSRFCQLYSPYIKTYSEWSYNLAINQFQGSYVSTDTSSKYPEPVVHKGYPYYWTNMPCTDDAVMLRYISGASYSCFASEREQNMSCVVGLSQKAVLYETDSGVVIHDIHTSSRFRSAYISAKMLWTGEGVGYLSGWCVETGAQEFHEEIVQEGHVIGIGSVDKFIACGTGGENWVEENNTYFVGTIALVDEEDKKVTTKWSTELECFSYAFDNDNKVIFSGHKGVVRCWDLQGSMLYEVKVRSRVRFQREDGRFTLTDGRVHSLSINPVHRHVLLVGQERFNSIVHQREVTSSIKCDINGKLLLHNNTGDRVFCVGSDNRTIMVYDVNGNLQNKIEGHSEDINDMCLVPGSNDLMTAGNDASILFTIPTTPVDQSDDQVIVWCDFLPGGDEFAALTEKGSIQVCNTNTLERRVSKFDDEGLVYKHAAVHPDGKHILVSGDEYLDCINTDNLEVIATGEVDYHRIDDIKISSDGNNCVVSTEDGACVFSITDVNIKRGELNVCAEYGIGIRDNIYSCDIHRDNVGVVSGSEECVDMWNITTGDKITTFREKKDMHFRYIKFLYKPNRIVYAARGEVHIMDMKGVGITKLDSWKLDSCVNRQSPSLTLLRNGTQLLTSETDKTLRLHDVQTGQVLYRFFHHRSEEFTCLAVHPSNNMILAYNKNKLFYVLKNCEFVMYQETSF